MRLSAFFILLALFSCSDDDANNDKKENSNTNFKTNEISSNNLAADFNLSEVELLNGKDSISYLIGFEISKPIYSNPELKVFDRAILYQGFEEETGTYNLVECQNNFQAFMASPGTIKDPDFAEKCALSLGRLSMENYEKNMKQLGVLDLFNRKMICKGFKDGLSSNYAFRDDEKSVQMLFSQLDQVIAERQQAKYASIKQEGLDFLAKNRNKKGVQETASGIQYKILRKGKGSHPKATSRVKVHYKGSVISGEVFDSSYDRGEPAIFGLNQVIRGWTEGIQLMRPGSKFIFYIPQELAYGANPSPGSVIKPYSLLIFEVELLEIF